jgi:hypothetical protein
MNGLRKCGGILLAIRKNETTWFEGKWVQLEDIMLSEVKPGPERQRLMFSLICGR